MSDVDDALKELRMGLVLAREQQLVEVLAARIQELEARVADFETSTIGWQKERIKELEAERDELIEDVQARADIARQQAVRIQHLEQALREIESNPYVKGNAAGIQSIARAAITAATQGEVDLEASEVVHATVYTPPTGDAE